MATFFQRLFGFSGIRARRSSLQLQPAKWKRILLSLERLEDRLAPATLTDGLAGTSADTLYSLSNGNLYNTTTKQVIANNVASFAQSSQGELCYLQNNGQLWLYGHASPLTRNVAKYAFDAAGSVVYLGLNGVLNSSTVSQPLDNGTPIIRFEMDGSGSAAVLDQNGNLIRFTPGSETPNVLDHTVTDSTGKVTSSVVTFGVDGTGSVIDLDSNGNLNRFASGSNTVQLLDNNVSKFVLDGAGSIVALEPTGNSAPQPLADGQNYSAPTFNLVGFVMDPASGSLVKTTMDTGVTMIVVDSDGSVVALDSLAISSTPLANGQTYSTPSYTMVRFAPGSTVKQTIDSGVTQIALNGTGAVVALDSLSSTAAATLGNGQLSSAPVYSLVEFAPGSTVRQVLDSGVSRFAVDAAGDVIALDNLTLKNETLPGRDGQVASYPLWNLVAFAASSGKKLPIDKLPVSTFELDGSGSVVALDNLSLDSTGNGPEYDLARFLPAATPGTYVRRIMDHFVSQIVVDASGAVFDLDLKYRQTETFSNGQTITVPLYSSLLRFAPGSDKGVTVDGNVSSIAIDGSGSVVALDSPTQDTLTDNIGAVYNEIVYNLVRFAPGAIAPDQKPMDTGVSSFTVDASGAVIAMDNLAPWGGGAGVFGNLELFSPGSDKAQSMAVHPVLGRPGPVVYASDPVSSFTLDGSGSVVALIDQSYLKTYTLTLARFTPGSTSVNPVSGSTGIQQLDTNVSSFVVDGSGSVVALKNGNLERFGIGSTTAQPLDGIFYGSVSTYAVDGSGSVVVLRTIGGVFNTGSTGSLWYFAPGSNTGQAMITGNSVTKFVVDASGSVVALSGGGLWLFAPGSASGVLAAGGGQTFSLPGNAWIDGATITEMNVDDLGDVVALTDTNNLVLFAPGSTSVSLLSSHAASFIEDGAGVVYALIDGQGTLPSGEHAPSEVYTLDQFEGAQGPTPVLQYVSNYYVDSTGSVVALAFPTDRSDGILYRFEPGSSSPVSINFSIGHGVGGTVAFVVDGDGYIVALENISQFAVPVWGLVQYAPGSDSGTEIDAYVQYFTLDNGSVVALDDWSTSNAVGQVAIFTPGSTNRQVLDSNAVSEIGIDGSNSIVALDSFNPTYLYGRLVHFVPEPNAAISLVTTNVVYQFFVDKNGLIIAHDFEVDPFGLPDLQQQCLESFDPEQQGKRTSNPLIHRELHC